MCHIVGQCTYTLCRMWWAYMKFICTRYDLLVFVVCLTINQIWFSNFPCTWCDVMAINVFVHNKKEQKFLSLEIDRETLHRAAFSAQAIRRKKNKWNIWKYENGKEMWGEEKIQRTHMHVRVSQRVKMRIIGWVLVYMRRTNLFSFLFLLLLIFSNNNNETTTTTAALEHKEIFPSQISSLLENENCAKMMRGQKNWASGVFFNLC